VCVWGGGDGVHQMLVYAYDANLMREIVNTAKGNKDVIHSTTKVGIEVNKHKTQHTVVSRHDNTDKSTV
jgi:hypothetical protein